MDLQLLLSKQEVTYGVDPTAAAVDTIRAEQVSFALRGERVTPQTAKPGSGGEADQTYGEHVEFGFKVPLIGGGTAGVAPKWGGLLLACGWEEIIVADTSVTYRPRANALLATSRTHRWRDGNRRDHLVKGWRGRVSLELSAGQRPMLSFMGRGLHTVVSQAGAVLAQADANFAGWLDSQTVAQGTTTFTLGGVGGLGIREFGFEAGDNVKFIDVPEQENVELRGPRAFTGRIKTTVPLAGTYNYETKWKDGSVETFAMVHGATAGRIVTVNGRTQLIQPEYARENDQDVVTCGLKLVPSALTTDDEISIVLT
jgi:hypothetical protein